MCRCMQMPGGNRKLANITPISRGFVGISVVSGDCRLMTGGDLHHPVWMRTGIPENSWRLWENQHIWQWQPPAKTSSSCKAVMSDFEDVLEMVMACLKWWWLFEIQMNVQVIHTHPLIILIYPSDVSTNHMKNHISCITTTYLIYPYHIDNINWIYQSSHHNPSC